MKNRLFRVIAKGLLGLIVVLLAGCPFITGPAGNTGNTGSLTIEVTNGIKARALTPGLSMDPSMYTISGTGPGSATFQRTTAGASVTVDALAFGSWTLVVQAVNADGTLIGMGSAAAAVHTGQTTAVAVTVTPLSGTGNLQIHLGWNAADVDMPSVQASLTPALGSALSLPFSIAGSQADYSAGGIPSGYSTLVLKLLDNGIVVMGAVDVVRIVTGQTTSGSYTFQNVNKPGGSIQIGISPDMKDPLSVEMQGASPTLAQGSTLPLHATVSNFSGNVVFVWYVNGSSAGTGDSWEMGSGLAAGYYRVDVTAFSADGTRAGSATALVQVITVTVPSVQLVKSFAGSGIHGIAAGPDGKIYLAQGDRISVRDPASLEEQGTIALSPSIYDWLDPVQLRTNPAGTLLAVALARYSNSGQVIDLRTNQVIRALDADSYSGVAWVDDQTVVFAGGTGLRKVNVQTGTVAYVRLLSYALSVAVDPARNVAAVGEIGLVEVFDLASMSVTKTINGIAPSGYGICFDSAGSNLLVAEASSLAVIDTAGWTVTARISYGGGLAAFHTDMLMLGSAAYLTLSDGTVVAIDTDSRSVTGTAPVGAWPAALAPSPGGDTIYVSNRASQSISIIDRASMTLRSARTISGFGSDIVDLDISRNGRYVAAALWDNSAVSIEDQATGSFTNVPLGELSGGWGNPRGVTVRSDGKVFAAGGNGTLWEVDSASGSITASAPLAGLNGDMLLNAGGDTLYVAQGLDPTVQVVSVRNDALVPGAVLSGWSGYTNELALNAGETQLAIATAMPAALVVYDLGTGTTQVHLLSNAGAYAESVCYSGDSNYIYCLYDSDESGRFGVATLDLRTGLLSQKTFAGSRPRCMRAIGQTAVAVLTAIGRDAGGYLQILSPQAGSVLASVPVRAFAEVMDVDPASREIVVGCFVAGADVYTVSGDLP